MASQKYRRKAMIEAGADRLGVSASIAILSELDA